MAAFENPALKSFLERLPDQLVLAQVFVRRTGNAFELRHVDDRNSPADKLRKVSESELHHLAHTTALGAYRPLKSAPNLAAGWIFHAPTEASLEWAVNRLYPGALADLMAVKTSPPPVTHYREFTARQSGMYRVTTFLNDAQAGRMMRACCHAHFCRKRRLWSVAGQMIDPAAEKSLIPCLEPCAILLEFARKAARMEQEEQFSVQLSASDAITIRTALESMLQRSDPAAREADFNSPQNPRRIALVLEKLAFAKASAESSEQE
jgi:hypothetical protein